MDDSLLINRPSGRCAWRGRKGPTADWGNVLGSNRPPRGKAGKKWVTPMRSRQLTVERGLIAIILVAVLLLVPEALRTRLWISGLPGPGLYPMVLLGLMGLIAVLIMAQSVLDPHGATSRDGEGDTGQASAGRLPLVVGASTLLLPLFLPIIGFRLLAFFYVAGLAAGLAPSWTFPRIALIIAVAGGLSTGLHFLFARLFNVVLPVGWATGI